MEIFYLIRDKTRWKRLPNQSNNVKQTGSTYKWWLMFADYREIMQIIFTSCLVAQYFSQRRVHVSYHKRNNAFRYRDNASGLCKYINTANCSEISENRNKKKNICNLYISNSWSLYKKNVSSFEKISTLSEFKYWNNYHQEYYEIWITATCLCQRDFIGSRCYIPRSTGSDYESRRYITGCHQIISCLIYAKFCNHIPFFFFLDVLVVIKT